MKASRTATLRSDGVRKVMQYLASRVGAVESVRSHRPRSGFARAGARELRGAPTAS